jgi:DNA ligase-1
MCSEKLDGMRCFWDGGVTRGMKKNDVPFANLDKDYRYKEEQIATGLWSRYGNVIHAPDWFLDQLPELLLDGELYLGRGDGARQELMSTIKDIKPGIGWQKVTYNIFDSPPASRVFADGLVKETNFTKQFSGVLDWFAKNSGKSLQDVLWFKMMYETLKANVKETANLRVHEQIEIPGDYEPYISSEVTRITELGGEGIIVRDPNSRYVCERTWKMMKIKKLSDAEGTVVGYISGRETDKGSKLLGMLGALILDYEGKRLELSGFTNTERMLHSSSVEWAKQHPETELPSDLKGAICFPLGSSVTFRYRGTSKDGIPQEARFWRRKVSE